MPVETESQALQTLANSIYSSLSWLLPIFLSFVATPIIVGSLGYAEYGVYAIVLSFVSFSFTYQVGRAAAKYVAEFRAAGETQKIADAVSATLWIGLLTGIIGLLSCLFAARLIASEVLQIEESLRDSAVMAIYIAGAIIVVTNLSLVFQSVLQGIHRFALYGILTGVSGVLTSLGSLVLALLGYGVAVLLIWNLTVVAVAGLAFYLSVARLLPEFSFRFRVERELRNAVIFYALSVIAYQIAGNLLVLFERAWIVRSFGAEALTFYVVPMSIGLYILAFIASLISVLFPMFNAMLDEVDRPRLVRIYQQASKIVTALIWFLAISVIAGGKVFLAAWVGADFAERSYALLVIHLVSLALMANVLVIWNIAESFGHARLNALSILIWLLVSAPLMVIASNSMASEGVAAARLIGLICCIPVFIFAERRFLGGPFFGFWSLVILKVAAASTILYAVETFLYSYLTPGWPALIISFITGGSIYWLILISLGLFTKDERQMATSIFRKYLS